MDYAMFLLIGVLVVWALVSEIRFIDEGIKSLHQARIEDSQEPVIEFLEYCNMAPSDEVMDPNYVEEYNLDEEYELDDEYELDEEELTIPTEFTESEDSDDTLVNPQYYMEGGIQTKDIIRDVNKKLDKYCTTYQGFLVGNIIKYITRFPGKGDPLGDLHKSKRYLEFLIEDWEKNNC